MNESGESAVLRHLASRRTRTQTDRQTQRDKQADTQQEWVIGRACQRMDRPFQSSRTVQIERLHHETVRLRQPLQRRFMYTTPVNI